MVGGGIFAVLGLSVQQARGGAPLAFAIAGVVALVTAYSYTKLAVQYPSKGGTVTFLDRAFGPSLFTGTLNILLWISYIVMGGMLLKRSTSIFNFSHNTGSDLMAKVS